MGGGGEGLARKIWIEKLLEFFPKSADENMGHINALNLYHWYKYSEYCEDHVCNLGFLP